MIDAMNVPCPIDLFRADDLTLSKDIYSNMSEAVDPTSKQSDQYLNNNKEPRVRENRGKKRVHFNDDDIIEQKLPTPSTAVPPIVDPDDSKHIWWDERDLQRRRHLDNIVIEENSLHCNPEYHESIFFLMKSYESKYRCRDDLTDRIRTIRATNVRGLEHRIVTPLRVIRRMSSRIILMEQKKLREKGVTTKDEMEHLLRRKSLKISRSSRQLSFRLAQLDRLDANAIYKEEEQCSQHDLSEVATFTKC